jgi:NitT/TauT family transport system permease protein
VGKDGRAMNDKRSTDLKWTLILLAVVFGFIVLWQLAVEQWGLINPAFVPAPTSILSALLDLLQEPEFWSALASSLRILAIGLAMAIVVGLVVGIVVGWLPVLHFTVAPFLWLLYSTPKVALAPLFILILGLGDSSKIALTFLLAVFPILLNTMEGVQTVPESLIRAGRVYGFRGISFGYKIVLPSVLPFSLAGIQRGVALGFTGVVLGEFLGGAGGLGHMLERAAFDFHMDEALAIVLVMVVVANLMLAAVSLARRTWAPWYDASSVGAAA